MPSSEDSCNRHKSMDEIFFIRPSGLLKSLSKKRRTPSPSPTCQSRNASRSSSPARDIYRSKSTGRRRASDTAIPSVTNSTRKGNTTPIIYSQSTARKTPPPVERKLQCTLEELWHGCIKKIKINRNVIRNGYVTIFLIPHACRDNYVNPRYIFMQDNGSGRRNPDDKSGTRMEERNKDYI